jgi:sodium/hydrogen antiporter
LTSEAGLNDGLAFPFVTLAVMLAQGPLVQWWHWIGLDLIAGMVMGAAIGWIGGWFMGWAMFRLPWLKLADTGDGLVAIGVVLIAYATAQIAGANGFVAVFVTAVSVRASEPEATFQRAMSRFAEQVERVLVMLVLVLFGWALGDGLLGALTWDGVLLAAALIFVLRPVAAWIGFLGMDLEWDAKALMAFFGIRGIGTLFYMQYAFFHADFGNHQLLWSVVAFVVLSSIVLHGMTSAPLMRLAQRKLEQAEQNCGSSLIPVPLSQPVPPEPLSKLRQHD